MERENNMNSNFMNIVAKAAENKSLFDSSVESIKNALDASVKVNQTIPQQMIPKAQPTTGWLRGALSYPWAIVCLVIPAVLDMAL